MRSERSDRVAFSRLEICVVLANLVLLVLVLIPVFFRSEKPLERAADSAPGALSADAPGHPKATLENQ